MKMISIKALWREHRVIRILALFLMICLVVALALYADELKSRQAERQFRAEFERIQMPPNAVVQATSTHHKPGSYRIAVEREFWSELEFIELINYFNQELPRQGWRQESSRLGTYCKGNTAAALESDCQDCGSARLILSQGYNQECGGVSLLQVLLQFGMSGFFLVKAATDIRTELRKQSDLEVGRVTGCLNALGGVMIGVLGIIGLAGGIYGLWLYLAPL